MTEIGVSLCDQNYRPPFPDRSITAEKDSEKDIFSLRTREERASLLKDGFTGKDIESEYLKLVIGIKLQDLKSK